RAGPEGAAYCAVAQGCLGAATNANWRRAKAQNLRHEAICGAGRAGGRVARHATDPPAITAAGFLSTGAGFLDSTAAGFLSTASASLRVIAAAARGVAGAATNATQRWCQQRGNHQGH